MKAAKAKPSCGWREWVALPGLGINQIKAKVDTGARTSALHAWHIHEATVDGEARARFCVHPNQRTMAGEVWCEAKIVDRREVRNTGGKAEPRYVVQTDVQMGTDIWPIEITLTSRDDMGFRMLLGRTAIRTRFVVDAGRSYLIGNKPVRKQ